METSAVLFVSVLLAASPDPAGAGEEREFVRADRCVECHLLAEGAGRSGAVLAWRRSVHFRENSACADCHGGDRLLPLDCTKGFMALQDREEAVRGCGRCHKPEALAARGMETGEQANPRCTADCIDCHGSHEVGKADASLVGESTCGRCHPFDRAKHTRETLRAVDRRLANVEGRIARAKDRGLPMEAAAAELAAVRGALAKSLHAVPPESLARHVEEELEGPVRRLEGRASRWTPAGWRIEGMGVLGLLAVILVLVRGYHASLSAEKRRGAKSRSRPSA